jgi:hypothetical protein
MGPTPIRSIVAHPSARAHPDGVRYLSIDLAYGVTP